MHWIYKLVIYLHRQQLQPTISSFPPCQEISPESRNSQTYRQIYGIINIYIYLYQMGWIQMKMGLERSYFSHSIWFRICVCRFVLLCFVLCFINSIDVHFGTRSMYLGHGSVITSHSLLWDVITNAWPRYMFLVPKCTSIRCMCYINLSPSLLLWCHCLYSSSASKIEYML